MTRWTLSYTNAIAPGDIRGLGRGDVIQLRESVRELDTWPGTRFALLIAIERGASVVWEDGKQWQT